MAEKILQCGYMSGDTYTAAALLALDRSARILLVKDTKATGEYRDKSGLIRSIFQESGVADRVTVIDISSFRLTIKEVWDAVKDRYRAGARTALPPTRPTGELEGVLKQLCHDHEPKGNWPRSITAVTGLVANEWRSNPERTQRLVATAWRVGKLPTEDKFALYEYMAGKFAKTGFNIRDNILVLWSRQSGKTGGAHLELDSSYSGIRQLARHFAITEPRATVLLSGDEHDDKLASLASESPQIINVAGMWNEGPWATHFAGAKFLAQFAFFKYLADDYRVVHLGMRSGMLESMALLGMETFYLEPLGSGSGDRMVAFQNRGITYRRIQIHAMPGLTARIVQNEPRLSNREKVDDFLTTGASMQERRRKLRQRFDTDRPREDYPWLAKAHAKAQLVGSRLESRSHDWEGVQDELDSLRGFNPTDLDSIVRLVSGKFKT